ncbi:MAG: Adaptive-response sensory-kinase SasA [Candidatus Udaeobacter sp.]|nr:MAG: Adaptive-response sensory-kinase SasA [Candidatus Udaeobacter sp.]
MNSTWNKTAESYGRIVLQVFLTGLAYYLATEIAWALCFPNSKVSLLFPPHAVLVAILLLVPVRHWWAYTLATIVAHFVATQQAHWPMLYALHCEAFDAVQNVLAAAGIRFFIKSPLRRITLRDAMVFVLIAVIIVPFCTAFWGAAFTVSNRFGTDYWVEWRNLGISNGVTAVVLVPAFLLVAERLSRRGSRTTTARLIEGSVLGLGIVVVGTYVFAIKPAGPDTSPALLYAPIPLLIWAALRFGLSGISAAMLVVTFEAIWGAMHGRGPFLLQSPAENALALQMFLMVTGTPLMFLSVLLEDEERSQQSLGESEGRFQTMADAAPVLIWVSGEDKLPTYFNKAWLEFTGRSMEQELGNGWKEGVHPDDLAKISQTYGPAVDAREPFVMQYRLKNSDGEYRWITDQGVPRHGPSGNFRGYVGACVDITDLLQKEQELHEIEERVALAAEAAHLGVWELDTVTNELWISDKVRELFQFDGEEEVTYAMLRARIHPEDRVAQDAAIQRAIVTKGGFDIEFRLLLPNDAVRWISARARCVDYGGRKALRLLSVAIDVTKRKETEEDARRQREQINLLGRVSLLGEMTASLAHELNQPLSAMVTNANAGMRLIDRGKEDPKILRDILSDVVSDGRRAHDIIQNVRNTIKKGDSNRRRINLNELVTNVTHSISADAMAYSCEVETSLAKDLPLIEGDPVQIQQVLVNLVSNALDAMRQTPPDRRKVEISTSGNGDNEVCLSVRDHGTGIRVEVHERLFDRFFTTKEQGLGMGLAIVRSIVKSHGGDIQAENVADGGARFYFTLPVKKKT